MERAFEDPITYDVMKEAVITPCGHSFSKDSITDWLQSSDLCPICKSKLSQQDIQPNYTLRDAIDAYLSTSQQPPNENTLQNSKLSSSSTNMKASYISSTREGKSVIRELAATNIEDGGNVLLKAFEKDSWMSYILPLEQDNTSRNASLVWFLTKMVEYGVKHGRVWGSYSSSNMKLEGTAVFQPPYEAGVSMWNMLRLGLGSLPFKLGMGASWRLYTLIDLSEKNHQQVMGDQKHWSLYTIGVLPELQRHGIGTSLLQPVLAIADSDGIPCYLDTPNEGSIKFFNKNGFQVVKEVVPDNAPKCWCMVRKPRKVQVEFPLNSNEHQVVQNSQQQPDPSHNDNNI